MRPTNLLVVLSLACVLPRLALAESFDPTFGAGGRVNLSTTANERMVGFHVLPDGRYLAVVRYWGSSCADSACIRVTRLNPDTSPDTSFGQDGARRYSLALRRIADSTVDSQGRLIVVGSRNDPQDFANYDFSVVRIATTGYLDDSFNGTGVKHVAFDAGGPGREYDLASAVAIDADDNIVVGGTIDRSSESDRDFGAVRLRAEDGQVDTEFGSDGTVVIAFDIDGPHADSMNALSIGPDGKITFGGTAFESSTGRSRIAIARVTASGELDANFCPDGCGFSTPQLNSGRRTYAFGNGSHSSALQDLLVRPDGRWVICGTYLQSPYLAATAMFGSEGMVIQEDLNGVVEAAECLRIALQPDGRLLMAGSSGLDGEQWRGLFVSRMTRGLDKDYSYAPGNSDFIYFTGSGMLVDEGPDTVGSLTLDSGRALLGFDFVAAGGTDDAAAVRITSDLIFSSGMQVF